MSDREPGPLGLPWRLCKAPGDPPEWMALDSSSRMRGFFLSKKTGEAVVAHMNGCHEAGVQPERLVSGIAMMRHQVAEIEADERFHYKPANVRVNVVLALEQTAMAAKHTVLTAALAELERTDAE